MHPDMSRYRPFKPARRYTVGEVALTIGVCAICIASVLAAMAVIFGVL